MKIKEITDREFEKTISENLHKYNREHCEWTKNNTTELPKEHIKHKLAVYDGEILVGGSIGDIAWKWYYLDQLWIDKNYRKLGIGTKIIKEVEKYAKEKNCLGVRVETWNFQAKGFYEKQGYEVYASFEDCPPGTIEYALKKKF